MSRGRKKLRCRKCKCCRHWFLPQPHNAWHQRYCSTRVCQIASHRESQRKYNAKHPDRYKGPADVTRVRNWREVHPFYWRHNPPLPRFVFLVTRKNNHSKRLGLRFERFEGHALRDVFALQLRVGKGLKCPFRFALHNLISHMPLEWYFFGCGRRKALSRGSIRVSRGPPARKACRRKA